MKQAELTLPQKRQLLSQLEAQLIELEQEVIAIHSRGAPVQLDQQAVGRVSRIDAIQQQQMAQANETQMSQQLLRIKQILLDPDEYGFCHECGESIGIGRLTIHPTAELCIQCQGELENL
ncbi:DnaK suppressor protein, putative [Shewanella sediminis HAW-EB3]|uniref:DnaK suppressor protein, putative n=1 Tax=Shewanella sediminis (strain HAW-EB3) TaxID=425104 RepID=A8G0D0_SHESH|nr:TraR/DksA C4-type zinc finger protein [Shewanella sediminis]ABV38553.1 DnaK suppressor protein, putative [Shewanella sediminis HAW-EB3]